nr:dihydroxyacetone kinase subunit DhaL [Actinomyces sp. 2119]
MSQLGVADLEAWVRRCAELVGARAEELTALDAAIGDADHGANMRRGLTAVVEVLDTGTFSSADALLKRVGMTLVSKVGGASGPLYGTFFMRMGASQQDVQSLDACRLAEAVEAGVAGIVARGRAAAGEKTMLDAWYPALEALREHPEDLGTAVCAAAQAAERGRDATESMVATKGRASYLAERSVGHIDPGAASTALILQALAETVATVADGGDSSSQGSTASRTGVVPEAATTTRAPGGASGPGTSVAASEQDSATPHTSTGAGPGPTGSDTAAQQGARVGIVLVSHSQVLAQDTLNLARQLVSSVETEVAVAAGLSDGGLGTDSAAVAAAVERVAAVSSGVLVLVDLGSAVMSADSALELVAPEVAARTRISSAPFLEGTIGAYAAAGIGRDLDSVTAEAESAAISKATQVSQLDRR